MSPMTSCTENGWQAGLRRHHQPRGVATAVAELDPVACPDSRRYTARLESARWQTCRAAAPAMASSAPGRGRADRPTLTRSARRGTNNTMRPRRHSITIAVWFCVSSLGCSRAKTTAQFGGPSRSVGQLIAKAENPAAHLRPRPAAVHALVVSNGDRVARWRHPIGPAARRQHAGLRLPPLPVRAVKVRHARRRRRRRACKMQRHRRRSRQRLRSRSRARAALGWRAASTAVRASRARVDR